MSGSSRQEADEIERQMTSSWIVEERDTQLLGLLVKNFGLTTFKDWQLDAIKAVMKGKNALVIQPTGSGKSLCFSFPPYAPEKLSVVVTPTISLMEDQVRGLTERGISAAHLGGGQKDSAVLPGLQSGKYRVLFVTPLLKQQFPRLSGLQDVSLGLTLAFEIEASEFVQVLRTGSSHYWLHSWRSRYFWQHAASPYLRPQVADCSTASNASQHHYLEVHP